VPDETKLAITNCASRGSVSSKTLGAVGHCGFHFDQVNKAGGEAGGTSPPLDLPTERAIPPEGNLRERALSPAPFIVRRSFFFHRRTSCVLCAFPTHAA